MRHFANASIHGSHLQMLLNGAFERADGATVTFALPENIAIAVRNLAVRSESDQSEMGTA
jgi:hypothetical protein